MTPELSAYVQFQPYSDGWDTRVVRLAPNVTVASRATVASTVPRMADLTGARPRSAPGSRASRTPSAAGAGSAAAQAARTPPAPGAREGGAGARARCGPRRYAITAAAAAGRQTNRAKPAPRTVQSTATPGYGETARIAPSGA